MNSSSSVSKELHWRVFVCFLLKCYFPELETSQFSVGNSYQWTYDIGRLGFHLLRLTALFKSSGRNGFLHCLVKHEYILFFNLFILKTITTVWTWTSLLYFVFAVQRLISLSFRPLAYFLSLICSVQCRQCSYYLRVLTAAVKRREFHKPWFYSFPYPPNPPCQHRGQLVPQHHTLQVNSIPPWAHIPPDALLNNVLNLMTTVDNKYSEEWNIRKGVLDS